jgi:hypothetical protein
VQVSQITIQQEHWSKCAVLCAVAFLIFRLVQNQLAKMRPPPMFSADHLLSLDEQLRAAREKQQAAVTKISIFIPHSVLMRLMLLKFTCRMLLLLWKMRQKNKRCDS